ncbi:MAG: type I restriction endonuclease subunit R [Bacteroidales bacterium]|nr:type I restriction endonuclease subunit R [Bacteroidales bacterium]
MTHLNIISQNPESTLVSEFKRDDKRERSYQSEAALEAAFIRQLQEQGYEYLQIADEQSLIGNLRAQLERLNDFKFSDSEWDLFFKMVLANQNDGIVEKTNTIQNDSVKVLSLVDGGRDGVSFRNIKLIDKDDIHRNSLQVINQYVVENGVRSNRYDVTILVNGLPLVHVELKKRGVDLKEAFNQINRYQRDSFWAGSGLFEYVQLFVISNGTFTRYYSNTTRNAHVKKANELKARNSTKSTGSFEFTSYWADEKNKVITDLVDFTSTFFAKHTLLNVLTKFCVFTAEKDLLVMRPYQIAATEKILQRILIASYDKKRLGTTAAGGYIWHTTGSGKTLTSFKTAQLASKMDGIDKVLFVVDRKDLDYQTMKEYDRFEKGAANSNANTAILQRQLEDPNCRIIVTTIQKLSRFIAKNCKHDIYDAHVVLIFDECHRSQFNQMHDSITHAFKRYHMFGFTGTPIFPKNSSSSGLPHLKTTEQAFGDRLHSYTIVNAINDRNVLPFRIDYIQTMKEKDGVPDDKVWGIDTDAAFMSPENISNVTRYILEHFDQKTKRNSFYKLKDKRVAGFNSILATSSIPAAVLYYNEFLRQMEALPSDKRLKIALIYSYGQNEADFEQEGFMDEENSDDTSGLDANSRDALEKAIANYNAMFHTNFGTSSEKFQNYYKDLSMRMKQKEVDLLIVVNMFLTGFDATTLNTLWVDKNLRMHGLLQAFSRTNRKLNSVKTFGNIVCFRNLENATNESLALFGDENAGGIVLLRKFEDYFYGYDDEGKHHAGYSELVEELLGQFPVGEPIMLEEDQKKFARLFGSLLKAINILQCFDDFKGAQLISERDMQDYQSMYIDIYNKFRGREKADKESINEDIVFEIELVKQVEVNIDYIISLIAKHHEEHTLNSEIRLSIAKAVDSSIELRNKKDLIEQFISSLTPEVSQVDVEWQEYVLRQRQMELDRIIEEEHLKSEPTRKFIEASFRDGIIRETGTDVAAILPPMSRFSKGRAAKKETVLARLREFFERFRDLI